MPPPKEVPSSLVDARLLGKPESFDGWHRLEGLERCLQKLCVCLLCAVGLTLGTNGEISWTDAQHGADAVRSVMFGTAALHAADVVQGYFSDTSGERWSTGRPGGMKMLGPASRTDLTDAPVRLQLRGRDGVLKGSTSTATRKRAARRSQRTSVSALLFACCQTDR